MSQRIEKFGDELTKLIKQGDELLMAMRNDCHPKEFEKRIKKALNKMVIR